MEMAMDNLISLLTEWNEGRTSLAAEDYGRLRRLAETQLGLETSINVGTYKEVAELAAAITDYLPRADGETLADVYTTLRTYVTKFGGVRSEKLKWDAAWDSLPARRWWQVTACLATRHG